VEILTIFIKKSTIEQDTCWLKGEKYSMKFEPIKSQRLYQQVINQIKNLIYEGKLKKGDKLPSERELTVLLGVSRASIREAFSALEMLGLIESRPGEGTFISQDLGGKIIEPLSLIFMLEQEGQQANLFQLRKVLEIECARSAASYVTDNDIKIMEECIKVMEEFPDNEEKNFEADRMLHYTIAKASGNTIVYHVLNAISEAMEAQIKSLRREILHKPENIPKLTAQHINIVEAIKTQQSRKAMEAMLEHMNFIVKNVEF